MRTMKDLKTFAEPKLDRREFTERTVLALLSGVTITISGCGDDDTPTGPTSPGGSADVMGAVSANHGHTATITSAQLTAGNAVMLNIRGNADHPHTVELGGAEVMQVAGGQRVSKSSSTDAGHSHTVTFN
jgi:hypothetical protein